MIKATAITDTWLKDSARDSKQCGHTVLAKRGLELELEHYELNNRTNHHYFLITAKGSGNQGYDGETRWFGFASDWQIEGTEPENNPIEAQPQNTPKAPPATPVKSYLIPGISAPVTDAQPIYAGSNFTWGEATMFGDRIPEHSGITDNIVKLAKYMDKVRKDLGGNPIKITSWYRDTATNKRVGGAKFSQHLHGNAVDFYVVGQSTVDTFKELKTFGGGKLSLALGSGFIHIDLRPGAPARWRYPGGPVVALW